MTSDHSSGEVDKFLGVYPIMLVLFKAKQSKSLEKTEELRSVIAHLEKSCMTFDHEGKGSLTVAEYFNVLKIQNGLDIEKDWVRALEQ